MTQVPTARHRGYQHLTLSCQSVGDRHNDAQQAGSAMFERNPIDNASAITVAVEITCADGRTIIGRAALDRGVSVHRLLASDDPFLCVEHVNGDLDFLPKSEIRGLKLIKPIAPRPLPQPALATEALQPERILGIAPDADWDTVRAAYRALAKRYHPDRFAGLDLPPEVNDYLDAKAKQIGQAFQLLKSARNGTP